MWAVRSRMVIRKLQRSAAVTAVVSATIVLAVAPATALSSTDRTGPPPESRACTQWFWQTDKQCAGYKTWCNENHAGYTVDSDMFGLATSFQCKFKAANGRLYDIDP